MARDVKDGGRPTLRAERAEATRRRILDAARRLFSERGYGATSLMAVAQGAGVAVQTVYATYGSKAGILRALRDEVVHQPEAESLYSAALHAAGADEALELFARSIQARWQAGADVVAVHTDAAASDASLRREVDAVLERRRTGIAALMAEIARGLRPGLLVEDAAAISDALTSPGVYLTLVRGAGWPDDRYAEWLAAALRMELLPPGSGPAMPTVAGDGGANAGPPREGRKKRKKAG